MENLHNMAFARTPMARPLQGTLRSVAAMTRDDLLVGTHDVGVHWFCCPTLLFNLIYFQEFKARHYTGNRMVVVGAGMLDHASFVEQVAKSFASTPSDATGIINV